MNMRLIRFSYQNRIAVGTVLQNKYVDLEALLQYHPRSASEIAFGIAGSMRQLLQWLAQPESAGLLEEMLEQHMDSVQQSPFLRDPAECRLLAPIHDPGKIICLGLNYADHAAEQGKAPPDKPMIFAKYASCIIGPEDSVVLPTKYTRKVDFEAELAVIIGKKAKEVSEADASMYIAGFTIMNDVTARDFQSEDKQWVRGKSCDTFAPMGPHILTADEIRDPHHLQIQLRLNGQTMQNSSTSQLVFKVPFLISYLSRTRTLEPGDVISTGTPPGVGVYRQPPLFLKAGDHMEAEIEGIGILSNPVVD
jgi:2-keto-4-pentenoate hydratase/2-oxohepta-3-ene-1,7-dioic acid hydratase in catechol pathway